MTPERARLVAEAQRLKAEGLLHREIGDAMGVKKSLVSELLNDPDRVKWRARRARYAGRCADCGAPTDGARGPGRGRARCSLCAPAARRIWTRPGVINLIRQFAELYGEQPTATDWNPAVAKRVGHPEKAERFYADGCWPHVNTVRGLFGTWNDAISAAGFTPLRARRRKRPVL